MKMTLLPKPVVHLEKDCSLDLQRLLRLLLQEIIRQRRRCKSGGGHGRLSLRYGLKAGGGAGRQGR